MILIHSWFPDIEIGNIHFAFRDYDIIVLHNITLEQNSRWRRFSAQKESMHKQTITVGCVGGVGSPPTKEMNSD